MISKRKLSSDVKAEFLESNINRNEEYRGDCHEEQVRGHKDDDSRKRNKLLKLCHDCQKNLPKISFIPCIWRGPVGKIRSCKDCKTNKTAENINEVAPVVVNKKQCHRCKELLGKKSFVYNQWKISADKTRCCIPCYEDTVTKEERLCHSCTEYCCKDAFSNVQWKGPYGRFRTCKECVKKEKPKPKLRKKDLANVQKDTNVESLKSNECGEIEQSKMTQVCKVKEKKKKEKEKEKKNFERDPVVIKRTISERVKTLPKNQEKKNLKFQWNSFPISQSDENFMAAKVIVKGSYGHISKDERSALSKHIKNSSTQMSIEQAISFRQVLLQQKAMLRHYRIQRNAKQLYEKYKKGSTIIELSQFIDCPPMNIFRSLLTSMNYPKAKIKKCLRNPEKEFKERERREFKEAESADTVSNVDQNKSKKFADAFEDVIATFLKKKGIAFVSQKQLELEQEKSFGTPILTPDFLILDAIEVNGNPVTWIDAKAFYGANIAFNIKKVRNQMSRYIDHWGSGAILYLHGFSEMLVMDGCTMLNAQSILSSKELSFSK